MRTITGGEKRNSIVDWTKDNPSENRLSPSRWRSVAGSVAVLCCFVFSLSYLTLGIANDWGSGNTATENAALANTDTGRSPISYLPIQKIHPGRRVAAHNPELSHTDRLSPEAATNIDPDATRMVTVEMTIPDGSRFEAEMLWSEEQIKASGAASGQVFMNRPEIGAVGLANVVSIKDCPPIATGTGRIVTGVFKHVSNDIVDVHIEGLDAPIGTTGNHPFWSEDRQQFVEARELKQGERLRTLDGITHVTELVPRDGPQTVYNLEVEFEHVFNVGRSGILVHNTACNFVYRSVNAGKVDYVGITNNLARRSAEHLGTKGIKIEKLMGNLTRSDARAVEQALIKIHKLGKSGGTLMNKINTIARTNPMYAAQLKRGLELLKSIGY